MELAKPTMVRAGRPRRPGMVTVLPSRGPPCPGAARPSRTSWPRPSGQWPALSTTSSTGPPGAARPASVSWPNGWPPSCAGTVAVPNGPAAAVTPCRVAVAASSAGLACAVLNVTATCAPRWALNACWKGALLAASSAKPRVAEAVEISRTVPITVACSLCRRIPPVAVLIAASQRAIALSRFTPAPARRCPGSGRRAAQPAWAPGPAARIGPGPRIRGAASTTGDREPHCMERRSRET